jgi:CubicO group peptidase (beta-lactamase class C family)
MKKKLDLPAAIFLLFVALASLRVEADGVDDFVRAQMRKQHIPGVSLAVIREGKPVKVLGYGLANVELNVPATPETVFRIGSVSKEFIATGIMLLAHDGKLSVDDKISKYLEDSPETWSEITIRHLLTHTSGLVREGPSFNALKPQSDAELIKSAYATPLVFKPGERWQYCNLGYFILAEIIAKVSTKPWPEFMSERVFKPLAMDSSRTLDAAAVVPNRASGYEYSNSAYHNAATLLALRPSGAFMSSIRDLIKWDAALNEAKLLPQAILEQMWTSATLADGASANYGFGWTIDKLGAHREVQHGGAINGFRAHYLRLPDDKLSVIVLANSESAPTDAIAAGVAARYVKDLLPTRRAIALSAQALDSFTGTYQFKSGGPVSFSREGSGLRVKAPGRGMDLQLLPDSPLTFFSADDLRLHFVFGQDAGANVSNVTVMLGDVEQNGGPRQP